MFSLHLIAALWEGIVFKASLKVVDDKKKKKKTTRQPVTQQHNYIPLKILTQLNVFYVILLFSVDSSVTTTLLELWELPRISASLYGRRMELKKLFLRCLHEIEVLPSMCCGPQTTIDPVVPIGYICGQTGAHDFFHYTDSCCFPWKSSPPGGCVQNAGRIICSHGCHVCTNHTIRATPLPRSSFPGRLLFIATLDGAWKNVLRLAAYQIVLRRMSWCRHRAGIKWSWNQDLALFAFPHLHRHWPGRALAHTHSLGHSCLAAARPHFVWAQRHRA